MSNDTLIEAAKAAPPVSAGVSLLVGVTLNEVLVFATLLYTIFLLIDKFPTVVERLRQGYNYIRRRI